MSMDRNPPSTRCSSPSTLATDWVIVSPSFKERRSKILSRNLVKEPTAPTPTFNLPSEIRMKIYRYALASPEPFNLLETDRGLRLAHIYHPTFPWSRFHLARQLLLVSRKTYEEAADVLYGANTFQFVYDLQTIRHLLAKLLPSTRACIKRINFQGASSLCFQSIYFDAQLEQLRAIWQTLATQDAAFRLQCIGFDAPISFGCDAEHKRRLTAALRKLFRLRIACTIKFSGAGAESSWQRRWDDRGFALTAERCLEDERIGAHVSTVAGEDSFAQKRSSVLVTFAAEGVP